MSIQTTVNRNLAFGVPGELALTGPNRTQPLIVNSSAATPNVFGYAMTLTGEDVTGDFDGPLEAQMGGTGIFAGILVDPKAHALYGTSGGGPLAPSLAIPDNSPAEGCTMGFPIVALPAAANVGDTVYYNTTTGAIVTTAPGAGVPAGCTLMPGATVYRFDTTGASLGVLQLTN